MTKLFGGSLAAGAALMAAVLATPCAAQMTIADCSKKDLAMFKRHEAKFAEISRKLQTINFDAMVREPQKHCKWLKEFALPNHDQWRQELETRLAGECRRDPLPWGHFVGAYRAVMITKRQIDSVCSGVVEY